MESGLREFVNYRHPGPRRVWKGGPEPRLLTPDPVDPGDPLMSSKLLQIIIKNKHFGTFAPRGSPGIPRGSPVVVGSRR